MRSASASRAFSTNSFTTLAGRSTTSPAAIWFATCSESKRIRFMPTTGAYPAHPDKDCPPGGAVGPWGIGLAMTGEARVSRHNNRRPRQLPQFFQQLGDVFGDPFGGTRRERAGLH